jgi:cellulase
LLQRLDVFIATTFPTKPSLQNQIYSTTFFFSQKTLTAKMPSTIATILAMASAVSAHTLLHDVWVNGVDQGDGRSEYIRSAPNNNPVKDLASTDIVCNVNGATAVPSFVSAAAGDKLGFEWYHNTRGDDIIDGSHNGPIITWIAPYTEGDATGAIWTKIAEDGYDGQWAVERLKANNGIAEFDLPAGLAAGQYLVRQEIIAHHESETTFDVNPARGAQFYPACVQLEVTSGGSDVPDQDFDFQVDYTYADPGIKFNIYNAFTSYSIPGPEVWTGSGSGSSPAPPASTSAPAVTPTATVVPTSTAAPTAAPTTLSTAISPAPTPTEQPTPPPAECANKKKRRSLKNKKAKKAKRSTSRVYRNL